MTTFPFAGYIYSPGLQGMKVSSQITVCHDIDNYLALRIETQIFSQSDHDVDNYQWTPTSQGEPSFGMISQDQ